jgi:hypothetical protein
MSFSGNMRILGQSATRVLAKMLGAILVSKARTAATEISLQMSVQYPDESGIVGLSAANDDGKRAGLGRNS